MCSLRNSLLLLLCIGVAAPAAARPRGPAAVWPGVSDVLLNVRVPAMTAARHIRVAAWGEDSEEPGSVLVFPSVHTGRVNTADQGVLPRTRFEISVTCPPDDPNFDCGSVGTVYLRAHWVCGGNATGVCAEVDFNLSTTMNGTITFNTENIGPAITTPRTAPVPQSRRLSARRVRRNVALPAPNAARTASSDSRRTVRARMRLATFEHAITKTNPDAPSRTSSTVRARDVI